MSSYFSTFISGFSEVIRKILKEQISDIKMGFLLDGLVAYQTLQSSENISKLPFFNNSFLLIKTIPNIKDYSTEQVLKQIISDPNLKVELPNSFSHHKTFRLVISKENRVVHTDKSLLNKLERKISAVTGLNTHPSHPDVEFWLIIRSEGYAFFGFRITYHTSDATALTKGELRPELAFILCWLAEINLSDIILDPFAGSGAIPIALAKHFPCQQILTGDKNKQLVFQLEQKMKRLAAHVIVQNIDVQYLNTFKDNSVDKIITDPPWGIYDSKLNLPDFYYHMLQEFLRVLKNQGLLILLTSQKELLEELLTKIPSLKLERSINILVSGKKAGVYKIRKT